MVEIFKTSVSDKFYANLLVNYIHRTFPQYQANFDLTDIDRILRIVTPGEINIREINRIVACLGYQSELLVDPKQHPIS